MSILLFVTLRCNLACKYCYVYEVTGRREYRLTGLDMPLDTAKRAVEFLFENSGNNRKLTIWFFGGEPTYHKDFINFTRELKRYAERLADKYNKEVSFGMTTNGVLLAGDKYAKFVAENFESISLSLDGIREHHDTFRVFRNSAGSWKLVVRGAKNLLKYGVKNLNFNDEYSPETVKYLSRDIRFLYELGEGKASIATEFAYEAKWTDEAYQILDRELEKAVDYAVEVLDKNCEIIHWNVLSHVAKVLFGLPYPDNQRCGLGQGFVAIAPDGKIYRCQRAIFRDKPIGDVWRGFNEERYRLWREYSRRKYFDKYNCWKCPFSVGCFLGCLYANLDVTGDMFKPAPSYCRIRRIWSKHAPKYFMSAKEHRCENKVVEWIRSLGLQEGSPLCP